MSDAAAVDRQAEAWLRLSDAALLSQCSVDLYRASGPGGQKRNKTSSAVRVHHEPTGLVVTAVESRSQHENRARATRRLREAIALHCRNPVRAAENPAYYLDALSRDASLHVSRRHTDYFLVVQHVLDVLLKTEGRTSDAAEHLQLSTGQLVRFMKTDEKVWQRANEIRREHGLQCLR